MVKIKIREGSTKKESRKKVFLTVFLGSIMVLSVFGYIFGQSSSGNEKPAVDGKTFGEYTFKMTTGGWFANVGDKQIVFRYLPDEVGAIDVSSVPNDALKKGKVYLTIDPDKRFNIAERDLYYDLKPNTNFQIACIEDKEGCAEMPLKACKDAEETVAVIELTVSNATSIVYDSNCITVKGDEVFVTKAVDKLLHAYFGIA